MKYLEGFYQVLSSEEMKHLKELGLNTDIHESRACAFEAGSSTITSRIFSSCENPGYDETGIFWYEAYTLQDMLLLLPKSIEPNIGSNVLYEKSLHYNAYGNVWRCSYVASNLNGCAWQTYVNEDPLKCVYDMLCWTLENGFFKPGENINNN